MFFRISAIVLFVSLLIITSERPFRAGSSYTLLYDTITEKKINLIDNNGKIYKGDEAFKFYEDNQKKQLLSSATKQNYLVTNDLIMKFYKEKKIIIHEGKILSGDYNVHREYFKFIKENLNKNNLKDRINVGDVSYSQLIGFDKDNNSYWNCNPQYINAVIVLSQYGEILDTFDISQFYQYIMAVAPNGDMYFMYTKDDGHYFYKIPGKWNLKETQITQPAIPQVTSLTATSYNTYKNMYHPIKAFDGDIKTAWLEAAKGPGIGESITLELDSEITVDSTITLQFQDEMKPHKADFKEPKTFKKVEFIIKEVYPSGKDDDTAITDIQFYYSFQEKEFGVMCYIIRQSFHKNQKVIRFHPANFQNRQVLHSLLSLRIQNPGNSEGGFLFP